MLVSVLWPSASTISGWPLVGVFDVVDLDVLAPERDAGGPDGS